MEKVSALTGRSKPNPRLQKMKNVLERKCFGTKTAKARITSPTSEPEKGE